MILWNGFQVTTQKEIGEKKKRLDNKTMESCEQEKLIDVASGRIIKKGIFFECQETHEELESH